MTGLDDAFGTSVEKGFDLRYVKNPLPAAPVPDPRYKDVPEVLDEIFSDNKRIGRKKEPYDF